MTEPRILAIDQGTTSVRASVVDASLKAEASASEVIERSFPAPGWVELDASEVVAATERVAASAIAAMDRDRASLVGLGLANQGETVVLWDRASGAPLAPAIVWQCRRTEAVCAELARDATERAFVERKTGLPIDPYFSATKLAWLLDHIPGARERARRGELCAGTLDTFTLFRLSGGRLHVTDPSTACRTLLADLETGCFADDLCERFRVPPSLLARVVASDEDLGPIRIAGVDVPVRALLCDQPSALLGTGCLAPGDVKCTYGTGAFLQVSTGARPAPGGPAQDGLLRSIAWKIAGKTAYLLEGSVLSAGDVLSWLRDGLGMIARPDEVDAILRSTPDSAGVLFAPLLTGLGAPRWSGEARGAVLGLHRGVRREHLIRAALEGVAHQVADVLDVASRVFEGDLAPMWADGGLSASTEFLLLQADLTGLSLRRAAEAEATTRGIAAIAAFGAGMIPSIAEATKAHAASLIEPALDAEGRRRARTRHARFLDLVTSESAIALSRSEGATE